MEGEVGVMFVAEHRHCEIVPAYWETILRHVDRPRPIRERERVTLQSGRTGYSSTPYSILNTPYIPRLVEAYMRRNMSE